MRLLVLAIATSRSLRQLGLYSGKRAREHMLTSPFNHPQRWRVFRVQLNETPAWLIYCLFGLIGLLGALVSG